MVNLSYEKNLLISQIILEMYRRKAKSLSTHEKFYLSESFLGAQLKKFLNLFILPSPPSPPSYAYKVSNQNQDFPFRNFISARFTRQYFTYFSLHRNFIQRLTFIGSSFLI